MHSAVVALLTALAPLSWAALPRVQLGPAGPDVSSIAWGILHLGQDDKVHSSADAKLLLEAAREAGITTFDLAPNYAGLPPPLGPGGQSLLWFAEAFRAMAQQYPDYRQSVEIIAKIGEMDNGGYVPGGPLPWIDTSSNYTHMIVDTYLRLLDTTYLDVLVWHQPDRLMDPTEVATTFRQLQDSGKVKFFGVSNYKPFQFKLLSSETERVGIKLVTNEIMLGPWFPEHIDDGTLEDAMERGIRPLAWGPLGGDPSGGVNLLFKKVWPGGSDADRKQQHIRRMLQVVGDELGVAEDVAALCWVLRHPSKVVPIIGTMNSSRISSQTKAVNVAARMTRQQWWQIADVAGVLIWGNPMPFVPEKKPTPAVTLV